MDSIADVKASAADGPGGAAAAPDSAVSAARGLRRDIPLAELFLEKRRVTVGRAAYCDVVLPHLNVASCHAYFEQTAGGLRVVDVTPVKGVIIGGRRTHEPALIATGERFGIGPYLFTLAGSVLRCLDSSRGLRLEARGVEKAIRLPGGRTRKLIEGIDLVVEPGEFVSLLGPSGSGKSTLMDCLNGRRRATGGKVLANGEDFYTHFDHFRNSLGYVPQKDIVHAGLPVGRALYYTARLRLPADTTRPQLESRIDEVLRQMELDRHRDTTIGSLSGGQVKRVSLGAELLDRPSLLYIDEATSGLDAGTEARMMALFRELADEGKSVICVTHNLLSVDRCHLVLVLAGGKLMYYGPPDDAPKYFGVNRLSDIYDRLGEKSPEAWASEFRASPFHEEFVARRLSTRPDGTEGADREKTAQAAEGVDRPRSEASKQGRMASTAPGMAAASRGMDSASPDSASGPRGADAAGRPHHRHRHRLSARFRRARKTAARVRGNWHQFRVVTARYVELLLRDPKSLRLLLLQAPVVGILLLAGFANKQYQVDLPRLRDLSADERHLLTVLDQVNGKLSAGSFAAGDRQADLSKLKFDVETPNPVLKSLKIKKTVTGYDLAQILQKVYDGKLDPSEALELEQTKITLQGGGGQPISGKEVAELLRTEGKKGLTHSLLQSSVKKPMIPEGTYHEPRLTYILLFIVAITIFWFGCNNAAKEIVKEEPIYSRERAANLGILPYLGSKFLVLSAIAAVQTLMLMTIVYGLVHVLTHPPNLPPPTYFYLAYGRQYAVLLLLAVTGIALGLLLSACVATPDRANALMPYVLIPQIILGGAIIPINGQPLTALANVLSPVYWAFRAIHRGASVYLPDYHLMYQSSEFSVGRACAYMTIQLVLLLAATAWFLRRKDVGRN